MGAAEGTEKGLGPFTYHRPYKPISREGTGPRWHSNVWPGWDHAMSAAQPGGSAIVLLLVAQVKLPQLSLPHTA